METILETSVHVYIFLIYTKTNNKKNKDGYTNNCCNVYNISVITKEDV